MRSMLHIQCAVRGLLTVNGQFCGPVDGGGQTFPAAQDAEIFIEYTPLAQSAAPLALEPSNRTANSSHVGRHRIGSTQRQSMHVAIWRSNRICDR